MRSRCRPVRAETQTHRSPTDGADRADRADGADGADRADRADGADRADQACMAWDVQGDSKTAALRT
jgi:hypothetical protein